ncbi:MAG: PAS-domain containing protein, partial [Candidatus Eiseniibacteriota bacterium]
MARVTLIAGAALLAAALLPAASDRAAAEPQLTRDQQRAALELTQEERAFLDAHPVIRLGRTNLAFPPIEFTDERGRVVGVTPDYLALVQMRLGIEIKVVAAPDWPAVLEMARRREVDLVGSISRTDERRRYLAFTEPYLTTSSVVIMRPSAGFIGGLWNLEGKQVAVERGFRVNEHLVLRYPSIRRIETDGTLAALMMVARGQADAYVGGLASASYLIERNQLTNLQIAAPADLPDSDQRFAVRGDWPLLASAIDKALAAVTPAETLAIRRTWLGTRLDYGITAWDVAKWGGGIALVVVLGFGGVVLWHRRLRAEITQRVAAEEALRASETRLADQLEVDETILTNMDQGLVMVDGDLGIEAFNARFLALFDLPDDALAIGSYFRDYLDRFYGDKPYGADWIRTALEHAHSTRPVSYEIARPDGRVIEVRQSPRPGGGWVRTYADITRRKRAEQRLAGQIAIAEGTLESMDQGLIMVDGALKLVAFNARYLRLFGVPDGIAELGMPYRTFLERAFGHSPEGREWIRLGMARAQLHESAVYQIEMNDGRTIEARQHPRDEGGWVRTYTDITEMKDAEAAVRRRLEIEELVSRISAAVNTATDDTLDASISDVL